ncbi:MAG: hypothetical protein FJY66_03830 [Calditrichaeota bacterium]|nr:hypothetical protein [Calditrichota bacterium]
MSSSPYSNASWIISFVSVLFLVLIVFVLAADQKSWWGISAITYLSPALQWSLVCLAAAFVLAALTGALSKMPKLPYWARYIWILLPILGVFLFLLREGYPLWGDGWLLVQRINQADPPLLSNWVLGRPEPLGLSFFVILRKLTTIDGRVLYQLLSVLSGIGILILLILFGRMLRFTPTQCLLWSLPLFASGSLALFAGYVENYPVLSVLWTATLLYAIAAAQSERLPFWPLLAAVPFLFLWHYGSLVLFPSIVLAGFLRSRKAALSTKNWLFLLLGVFVILFLLYLITPLSRGTRLFIALSPKTAADGYALFSGHHIFDFLLQILLAAPLACLLLILVQFVRRDFTTDGGVQVLSLAALFGWAAAFVFDPAFGMPLDWDLLALMLLPLNLLAGYALAKAESSSFIAERIAAAAVAVFLLIALPLILVHHRMELSEKRFRDTLSFHPERAAYGWEILAGLKTEQGDVDGWLDCLEHGAAASGNPRLLKNVAVVALRYERPDRAYAAVEKLRRIEPKDFGQASDQFALFLKFGFIEDAERMLPFLKKFCPPGENLNRHISTLARAKADTTRSVQVP